MRRIEHLTEAQSSAVVAWEQLLGPDRVRLGTSVDEACDHLYKGIQRIFAILMPKSRAEIEEIVRIATQYAIPVYPTSGGNNYGYGGIQSRGASCCLIDLSDMNAIIAMDHEQGLITVEPGVTTGQVREYLEKYNIPFLSPSIGIGPRASMIGSALEKGRSGTPYIDRLESLVALEAVLPDGSIFRSSSSQGEAVPFFKWGVGPYVDGLFVQSGMGIVTAATFALAPQAESVKVFSASAKGTELASLVNVLRGLQQSLGDALPNFSIQSADRILSRGTFVSLDQDKKRKIAGRLSEWTLFGVIRGDEGVARAARTRLERDMRIRGLSATVTSYAQLQLLEKCSKWLLRIGLFRQRVALLPKLRAFYRSASEGWIPFPSIDLTREHRIVAVVLPMKGASVAAYAEEARRLCTLHELPFVATIMNFTRQSILFTLHFDFDKDSVVDGERFRTCFRALQNAALAYGGYVYRASSDAMEASIDVSDSYWKFARRIKDAIDPANIMAPGRYDRSAES